MAEPGTRRLAPPWLPTQLRDWRKHTSELLVRAPFTAPGGGREIDLTRAIGRFCEADHGCDVAEINASRAQGGVDVLGNRFWRPMIPAIGADVARHQENVAVVPRRPSEAEAAQLSEVRVISGVGSRNRGVSNQDSAQYHGGGNSG